MAADPAARPAGEDSGAPAGGEAAHAAVPEPRRAREPLAVAAALAVGTLLLYLHVRHHAFVFLDDGQYVFENPRVRSGLSWANARWAFTTLYFNNWHPLTWLSHMLDVALFGVDPGAHHLVNAALHAANGAALLLVLHRTTGAPWRSAMVAALFAVHPLHVESVAWVAERKDVLSTLFGLLAIGAYARWVERPGAGRYALVVLCFALSLLAKPMWVTLPFLLLLLDGWPLGRVAGLPGARAGAPAAAAPRLLLEKLPLFAMSAASSAVTLAAQRLVATEEVGLGARLANAVVSCARYVRMTLWPADLAALYPYSPLPAWEVAAAALLLAGVTAAVLARSRRLPWAAVGWLWFLGTLVPVIGLVQVGSQAMADRYTYLPSVGLFVAAVWGAHHLAAGRTRLLGACAASVLLVLSVLTWRQAARWRDHETIFRHTVLVTRDNPVAHGILSMGLRRTGRPAEALEHATIATRLDPDDARHWAELSRVARELRRPQEAYDAARRAVAIAPEAGLTWSVLGQAAGDLGLADEAEAALRRAAALLPDVPQSWDDLGLALSRSGRTDEALDAHRRAVALDPGSVAAWTNLAILQQRLGRTAEAGEAFAAAVRADPSNPTAWRNLGLLQAMTGRPGDAVAAFEEGLRLKPADPELLVRLGLAQLALGARTDALATAARLDAVAPELAAELRARAGAAP